MDFPEVLESNQFLCILFFILFVLHRAQDFSQCLWTSRFFGVNSANPPKRYININHHRPAMHNPAPDRRGRGSGCLGDRAAARLGAVERGTSASARSLRSRLRLLEGPGCGLR